MRSVKIIILLICAALFLGACGRSSPATDDAEVLTVAIGTSPHALTGTALQFRLSITL